MSIREDNKRYRIRDAREFQSIRVWLAKCLERDELVMLARLSVFAGSFNAEGAAAIGNAHSQTLPLTHQRWRQSPLVNIAAASLIVLALSKRSGLLAAGAVAVMACMRFGIRMHASESASSARACGHGGREVAIVLEDMRDCALLEAATPPGSSPCSQPAAAELLAPRYKMHALIREAAREHLKELKGSRVQEAQLAFVQWMATQAQQLNELVPGSAQCSPASAAQLISNKILNFRQVHRALASIQHASPAAPEQASLYLEVDQLVLDLHSCGCLADAALIGRQNLIRHEAMLGHEHPRTLLTMGNIAMALLEAGKLEEGAHMQRQVLEAQERLLGPEHPNTLNTRGNLAVALQEMGTLKEAAEMQRQVLKAKQRVLGRNHLSTLATMRNFAMALQALGKWKEAAEMQRQAMEAKQQVLGHEHPHTLATMGNLALALQALGKLEEAAGNLGLLLEAQERVLGQEHQNTLKTRGNLARVLMDLGKLEEAATMLRLLLQAQQRVWDRSIQIPSLPGPTSQWRCKHWGSWRRREDYIGSC